MASHPLSRRPRDRHHHPGPELRHRIAELPDPRYGRRTFLRRAGSGSLVAVFGGGVLLAACARGEDGETAPATEGSGEAEAPTEPEEPEATAVVDDVIDFALSSDDWPGAFGFVTLRLRRGLVDGNDVYFIRTDTSDEEFAEREGLVHVPKLSPLAADGLSLPMYVFENGVEEQAPVLASEPGRDDYTPAWRVHEARFTGEPRLLGSVAEVEEATDAGDLDVTQTDVVVNAPLVKWSDGELPVDDELESYLPAQLISPPDLEAMEVTFKLNQCYPATWYIVTDHSIEPAAEMTETIFAPGLHEGPREAGATGRTNVLMNGIEGPGPMGFQPSAFDFAVGEDEWSPYWDHFAYRWRDESQARLLTSQSEIEEARDAGELEEFPGVPDTEGEVFTVNCPSPVAGPTTFEAPGGSP